MEKMKKVMKFFLAFLMVFLSLDLKLEVKGKDVTTDEQEITYDNATFAISESGIAYITETGDLYAVSIGNIERLYDEFPFTQANGFDNPKLLATDVKEVAFAQYVPYYLKNDGTLWQFAEIGENGIKLREEPIKVLDHVVKLGNTVDMPYFAAIKDDGSLWTWGDNGIENTLLSTTKGIIAQPTKVKDNIKDINFQFWNTNVLSEDGVMSTVLDYNNLDVIITTGVDKMISGSCIIRENGDLYSWGINTYAQIGNGKYGSREKVELPFKVAEHVGNAIVHDSLRAYITEDNRLYATGELWGSTTGGNADIRDIIFGIDGFDFSNHPDYVYLNGIVTQSKLMTRPALVTNKKIANIHFNYTKGVVYLETSGDLVFTGDYQSNGWYLTHSCTNKLLANNVKTKNTTVINRPKSTYSEKDIFQLYPESLTNVSDDIMDMTFNHSNTLLSNRTFTDDLLTSYKYLLNFDNTLESILKAGVGLATSNNVMYEECVDKIILEICTESSEMPDITKKYIEAQTDLSEDWATFKKMFGYAETLSQKVEVIKRFKKFFKFESDKDIEKLIKSYEDNFDNANKYLDNIDTAIDVWDIYQLTFKLNSLKKNNVIILRDAFPENSFIRKRFDHLLDRLEDQSSILLASCFDFGESEVYDFISGCLEDKLKDELTEYISNGSSSSINLTYKLAKYSLKQISKEIDVPTYDEVMNSVIYSSINGLLYTELYAMRNEFIANKDSGIHPEDIDSKISIYKVLYNSTNNSFIKMLENEKTMGSVADQNSTKLLKEELISLTYDKYLEKCVEKIRNKESLEYFVKENEAYITGVKSSIQTDEKYARSLNLEQDYLIIPDTIDGYPIVSILDDAIPDNYKNIIFGKNLKRIESTSLRNLMKLEMITFQGSQVTINGDNLPLNLKTIYTTSSANFTNIDSEVQVKTLVSNIVDLNISEYPQNLSYDSTKPYKSEGMVISATDLDGTSYEISSGWLEIVVIDKGEVTLNVIYGGKSLEIPLTFQKEEMQYDVNYYDEGHNKIEATKQKKALFSDGISEDALKINNYIPDEIEKDAVMDYDGRSVDFIYKKVLEFNQDVYLLNQGEKEEFKVFNRINDTELQVESSDESIAKVVGNEIVSVSSGICEIEASDKAGNVVTSFVYVQNPLRDFNIDDTNLTMKVNEQKQIKLTLVPINPSDLVDVSYTVQDDRIVTVDTDGKITALKTGSTLIKVDVNGNEKSIAVNVVKGIPQYPVLSIYNVNEKDTLGDIELPEGFSFQDILSTSVGESGEHIYFVSFTPKDLENYIVVEDIPLKVIVKKDNNQGSNDNDYEEDGKGDSNVDNIENSKENDKNESTNESTNAKESDEKKDDSTILEVDNQTNEKKSESLPKGNVLTGIQGFVGVVISLCLSCFAILLLLKHKKID